MIKIKINDKSYLIKKISELTFNEFNQIIIKSSIISLPEYLAAVTDYDIEELLNSTIEAASLPGIYNSIFDVEIDKEMKSKKYSFDNDGEIISLSNLKIATFGQAYMVETYRGLLEAKKKNYYEYCLYVFAIALEGSLDASKIEAKFNYLKSKVWRQVLPHAFFLAKKLRKKKMFFINESAIYIWELKTIRMRICSYRRSLEKLDRI